MRYHVNGELVDAEEAAVSVRDRGFRYGDAAFETLRAYGGGLFEWSAHAERLGETCRVLGLDHGLADEDLRGRIEETLDANRLEDAYVRLAVSRGVQPGTLTPRPVDAPTVVVEVASLPRGGVGSTPVWDDPARARVVETRRVPDAAVPARAKTHSYLNGVLARLELRGTDDDEALLLDERGALTEGATSNLFLVEGDRLRTPALDGPVLPGVTRRVVIELARQAGYAVEETTLTPDRFATADEAFLTNTTWELRPMTAVDDVDLGVGPVTERLLKAFDALVDDRHY